MQTVIRIKRLKKDGSIDKNDLAAVITALRNGEHVALPVDGIYGLAHIPDKNADAIHHQMGNESEYIVDDFGAIERWARFDKSDYDFLKRVWPDEVTVLLDSLNDDAEPVRIRMVQTQASKEILSLSGGVLEFMPILNDKGRPYYKKTDIENAVKGQARIFLLIDEWCKSHPLPTVIDIRNGSLRLIRTGRISMDEISSLFFLGSSAEDK
jgi:tRNA A37 threonylcarbamoyladenosine synthetase subunit TsaC/SUA5/YrdC